jgi:hypothetical protein
VRVLVGDLEAVVLLDGELDLDERERIEAHVLEAQAGVVANDVLGQTDAPHEDVLQILVRELLD